MKNLSLLMRYEKILLQGKHLPNNLQRQVIILLDQIQSNLIFHKQNSISRITDLLRFIFKLKNKKKMFITS